MTPEKQKEFNNELFPYLDMMNLRFVAGATVKEEASKVLLDWIEAYKNEEVKKAWEDGFSKGVQCAELSEKADTSIIKSRRNY